MSTAHPSALSRRRFLGGVAMLGGAGLLAACGTATAVTTTASGSAAGTAAAVTSAATTSAAAATSAATTAKAAPAPTAAVPTPGAFATALPAPAGKKAVTLRLHARAGVEDQMFGIELPKFQQANPGVAVSYEVFDGTEYEQKLETLTAGGNLGDVVHLFTGDQIYQNFFVSGVTIPLDNLVAQEKFDLTQYYKYSIEGGQVNGKLGGLPFKSHPSRCGLFYNVDMFQKAGIKEPSPDMTIDEFTSAAQKLTVPGDAATATYGYGFLWNDLEYYECVARQYGGDLFSDDGSKWTGSTPEAQKAWQYHYDLMNTWKVSINPLQTAPTNSDLFLSGRLGMYRANIGTKASFLQVKKFKWNMTVPPKGPTGQYGSYAETDLLSITKFSKAVDEAWPLLKWLTSKESGLELAKQTGNRSSTAGGRPDVYNDPSFLSLPGYPDGVQKTTQMAMNQVQPYRTAANFRGPELLRTIEPTMELLILGKAKPDSAWLAKLGQDAQDVMDKPRA
jgi:multiple sugar transport system substrate-binding protein